MEKYIGLKRVKYPHTVTKHACNWQDIEITTVTVMDMILCSEMYMVLSK